MIRSSMLTISVISALIISASFTTYVNKYKKEGTIIFPYLDEKITVKRDKKGTPYIYGNHFKDLIMAQGYVTAQDRLFQMHMAKLISSGRLSEVTGEKGVKNDIRMRTLGFRRNAEKHAKILSRNSLNLLEFYAEGVNRFIRDRKSEYHLEFKLAGIEPEKWEVADSLSILYYMAWGSAANIQTEITTSKIIDKLRGASIDDFLSDSGIKYKRDLPRELFSVFSKFEDVFGNESLGVGSNCWITGSKKSNGGKPILSNDPHIDARLLPGPWYPSVLISDKLRVAGVTIPGIPGIIIGRNRWITCGITNSYGDTQDLYIERIDPLNSRHYLEGRESYPFEIIPEKIKIKDGSRFKVKEINVRLTKRGPVISDLFDNFEKQIVTLRWSPYEEMGKDLGLDYLLKSKSFSAARKTLKDVTTICLNVLIADKNGNFGFQTTGRIPIRKPGEGSIPYIIKSSKDNWNGWIPFDEMPHKINSKRNWIASANNKSTPFLYPYYYSSYFSPNYRYNRIQELLSTPGRISSETHFKYQDDTHNINARRLSPVFCSALLLNRETNAIGMKLNEWDFEDKKESVGATIFHELYKNLALQIFQDELGPKDTLSMLKVWYFWQEYFEKTILEGQSKWFDNIMTSQKETLEILIQRAGKETIRNLEEKFGRDINTWKWGKIHTINFRNPLFSEGFLRDIFGSGDIQYDGSVDTIKRGLYSFDGNYETTISASMRMVCDLSDDDKFILTLAGGVTGRLFSNNLKDQIKPFINSEKEYIYFSDKLIEKNKICEMVLLP